MGAKGKNRASKWPSKGGGLKKHAKSGVPYNHANSIARTREVNKKLDEEAARKERLRLKWLEENSAPKSP